jgi:hypothetical protein
MTLDCRSGPGLRGGRCEGTTVGCGARQRSNGNGYHCSANLRDVAGAWRVDVTDVGQVGRRGRRGPWRGAGGDLQDEAVEGDRAGRRDRRRFRECERPRPALGFNVTPVRTFSPSTTDARVSTSDADVSPTVHPDGRHPSRGASSGSGSDPDVSRTNRSGSREPKSRASEGARLGRPGQVRLNVRLTHFWPRPGRRPGRISARWAPASARCLSTSSRSASSRRRPSGGWPQRACRPPR